MTEISDFFPEYQKNKTDYNYLVSSMENIKEKWEEIPFTKDNMKRNILLITNQMNHHIKKIKSKSELDIVLFSFKIILEKFKSFQSEIERKYQFVIIHRDNIEEIFASVQNEIDSSLQYMDYIKYIASVQRTIHKSLDYYKMFTKILIQEIIMDYPGFTYKSRLDLIYEFPHLPWTIGNEEFYLGSSGQSLLNDEFMSFFKKNIHLDWNYIMFFKLIERTNSIPLFNRHFTYEVLVKLVKQNPEDELCGLKLGGYPLWKTSFAEACDLHPLLTFGNCLVLCENCGTKDVNLFTHERRYCCNVCRDVVMSHLDLRGESSGFCSTNFTSK